MKNFLRGLVATLTLAAAGCGGGGASLDTFVGMWKYTAGTLTTTCMGSSRTDQLTGNETITKGSSSDLVLSGSLFGTGCPVKLNVSGDTASATAGQTCTVMDASGTIMINLGSFTFSSSDGKRARAAGNTTATVTSGGASVTCMQTASADLEKL